MLENSKTVKSRNRRVVNGLAVTNSWDWLVRLEFFSETSNIASLCGGTVGRGRPLSRLLGRLFMPTVDSVTTSYETNNTIYTPLYTTTPFTVIHRNFVLTAAHCCIGKNSVIMNFQEIQSNNSKVL